MSLTEHALQLFLVLVVLGSSDDLQIRVESRELDDSFVCVRLIVQSQHAGFG